MNHDPITHVMKEVGTIYIIEHKYSGYNLFSSGIRSTDRQITIHTERDIDTSTIQATTAGFLREIDKVELFFHKWCCRWEVIKRRVCLCPVFLWLLTAKTAVFVIYDSYIYNSYSYIATDGYQRTQLFWQLPMSVADSTVWPHFDANSRFVLIDPM